MQTHANRSDFIGFGPFSRPSDAPRLAPLMVTSVILALLTSWLIDSAQWLLGEVEKLPEGQRYLALTFIVGCGTLVYWTVLRAAKAGVKWLSIRRRVKVEPDKLMPAHHDVDGGQFVVFQDMTFTASPHYPVTIRLFFKVRVSADEFRNYEPAASDVSGWGTSRWNVSELPLLVFPLNLAQGQSARGYVAFKLWRRNPNSPRPPQRAEEGTLRVTESYSGRLIWEKKTSVISTGLLP